MTPPLPGFADGKTSRIASDSKTCASLRTLGPSIRSLSTVRLDLVVTVTDDLADRDPVLAALASASVYGLPPAGPARRKPTLVALSGHGGR